MKKEIINILIKNQVMVKLGSDGDYSSEQAILADRFDDVADEIIKAISKMMRRTKGKTEFEKMEFLRTAIKAKKEIAAFHLNDTFLDFADKFYKGKPHKSAMANFKKYLKDAAMLCGVKLSNVKCDKIDRIDFGVRTIWSITYSENINPPQRPRRTI